NTRYFMHFDPFWPFWSSDGTAIGTVGPNVQRIFLNRPDDQEPEPLATTIPADPRGGDWAGEYIVFSADAGAGLYRLNTRDRTLTRFPTHTLQGAQPVWKAPRFLRDGRHFLILNGDDGCLYRGDAPTATIELSATTYCSITAWALLQGDAAGQDLALTL